MDSSRRKTNLNHYNENGTMRKQRSEIQKKSKHYIKYQNE